MKHFIIIIYLFTSFLRLKYRHGLVYFTLNIKSPQFVNSASKRFEMQNVIFEPAIEAKFAIHNL